MKRYIILGALGGVALIGVVAVRRPDRAGAAPRAAVPADSGPVTVLGASDVARAVRADLIAGLPVSGTLKPSLSIRIAAPIAEVVEAVLVKEGEAVRQGQSLARFRASALEPAAPSAQAGRRTAAPDHWRRQHPFHEGPVAPRH